MSWVWMWSNFKITLVRGPHEYPIEQSKQTVKAKSSCQSQQRNANQSKASAHNMRKQSAYHQSEVKLSEQSERLSQPASPPASQPVSQPASQPASQPTNQPTKANRICKASKAKQIKQARQLTTPSKQTTTSLAYWSWGRKGGRTDPKSCFKISQNRIYDS